MPVTATIRIAPGAAPDASGVVTRVADAPRKLLALDLPPDADELIGLTLGGRYQVEAILGQGGMGTVYRVRHAVIGRSFALKVLRREIVVDPESVRRFMQEARITASIEHENMIEVIDFGEVTASELASLKTARQPYFVMELLQGETLAQVIAREGAVDAIEVAAIFAQVANALAAAHARGVVHRDLKPDNVFLVALPGGKRRAKVLDFGVAKLLSGAKITRKGTVFGTPYYMSPEQASGGDIDGRADQYALGVVMYEALSGRVPFDDDNHMGVMTKHIFAQPEPIQAVVRDPARLGALGPIVMRCLEKRVEARFATTGELAQALAAVAEGRPVSVAPAPNPSPLGLGAVAAGSAPKLPPTLIDRGSARPLGQGARAPRVGLFGAFAVGLGVIALALGLAVLLRDNPPTLAPPPAAASDESATEPPASAESVHFDKPGREQLSPSAEPSAPAAAKTQAPEPSPRPQPGFPAGRGRAPASSAPKTVKTVDPNVW